MIFRKIWATALLSVALVMSDVSLGAEESLTYDVDGDGVQSSFTDGILIISLFIRVFRECFDLRSSRMMVLRGDC